MNIFLSVGCLGHSRARSHKCCPFYSELAGIDALEGCLVPWQRRREVADTTSTRLKKNHLPHTTQEFVCGDEDSP